MDGPSDRELRYFVAVAEELNFTRAAERLGMAQPPLSRAIRQLERRLGADLFVRDGRQVQLTDFGAGLVEEARHALDVLDSLGRRARRAARPSPTVVVTAKPGHPTELLRQIADSYAGRPGALPVEFLVSGYRAQADLVREGRADLALLSSPFELGGLDFEPLTSQPRVAAVPAGHPLARRTALRCRDLAGEPVPRWPDESVAERSYWTGRDGDGGANEDPPGGPRVSDPSQLLEVIGLGQAVALIPATLAERNPRPDIAYRPVVDASPYRITIAWSAGSRSRPIADLVRIATSRFGELSKLG
ncbi:LysR family transcriptional regulator [Microlunatus parietis]|uniref:DNA-binding transcriptional LysR family regulator n=1 Tax=Microlunatus parietis TaxID=682979 RepID=A0A7Y9ICZ7_9ACTN|nr:LysR family transcriptional regulator [Microlunatus parietis]NYE74455.1 DNA-binding transcriptional LysR family regulator [Microlunatus parietis]